MFLRKMRTTFHGVSPWRFCCKWRRSVVSCIALQLKPQMNFFLVHTWPAQLHWDRRSTHVVAAIPGAPAEAPSAYRRRAPASAALVPRCGAVLSLGAPSGQLCRGFVQLQVSTQLRSPRDWLQLLPRVVQPTGTLCPNLLRIPWALHATYAMAEIKTR